MYNFRKQGERGAEGETRKKILSYIISRPKGIEEGEIRNLLFAEKGIKEKKGIIKHLEKLKGENLIKKRKDGVNNVWEINTDFVSHKEFLDAIRDEVIDLDSVEIQTFLRMNETMINEELLDFLGISLGAKKEREKLLSMLCFSPSVFRTLLFDLLPILTQLEQAIEKGLDLIKNELGDDNIINETIKVSPQKIDELLNKDSSEKKGLILKLFMQLLESTFFMDMFSFSFSNLKKSEFERIRKAFKMKIESKDEGFYNCSIEINQKGKFYFDENKENYFIFLH